VARLPGGSPAARRQELRTILRRLRVELGLKVEEVARQLLLSPKQGQPSGASQRGANTRDIRDLCFLYSVSANERQMSARPSGRSRS
jgi:hypothetical protein